MAEGKNTQFPAWVVILVLSALLIITFSVLVMMGTLKLIPEPPYSPEDPFVLYALTAFNFVAFFVFSFILARLLLRLWRERRAHRLGSRLKSRLVRYFLVISILPLVALGLFSYLFINVTIDKWFGQHHQAVLRDAEIMYRDYLEDEIRDFHQLTEALRTALETPDGDRAVSASLPPEIIQSPEMLLLEVIGQSGQNISRFVKGEAPVISRLTPTLNRARAAISAGRAFTERMTGPGKTFLLVTAVPFQTRRGGLLAVYRSIPDLAERAAHIAYQHELYESLYRKQGKIRRTTFQVLAVITFLLLFAATWTAMHLSKGITQPIQALAEATQKVARGDFDQQVTCVAEDELAMLVDSFNRMTAQLKENREQLEASAKRLRETNRRLEERRRYIETVLESLSTGIISIDSEHRITTLNRAAMRILGLTEPPPNQTSITESLSPLLGQNNMKVIEHLFGKAHRTGFAAGDIELEGSMGASHLVISASALRDEHDHLHGFVLMIEDITELVRAQRQAVWSEVARRMAHEIKNPLTPIQLSAERISRNLERADRSLASSRYKQLIRECTETIMSEVQTLQRMVNEFARFARLPRAELEDRSLNDIVLATIKLYEDRLDDVLIESTLSADLPLVKLDAEQIKRALVNLLDNALAAVRQVTGQRRITVETRYCGDREMVELIVSDTGVGIDPKDYPRLFTPYFSKRAHGTGLGLAIVNHIIAEHRGRVRAEPNRPRGARFIIELPTSRDAEFRAVG